MSGARLDQAVDHGPADRQIVEVLAKAGGAMRKNAIFDRLPGKPTMLEFNKAFDDLRSAKRLVQDNMAGMIVYRLPKEPDQAPAEVALAAPAALSPMARQRLRREAEAAAVGQSQDATEIGQATTEAPPKPTKRRAPCRATSEDVLALLQGRAEPISTGTIAAELGAHQSWVWKLMQPLIYQKLIEQIGGGCKSRWRAADQAPAASAETPAERPSRGDAPEPGAGAIDAAAGPSSDDLPPTASAMLKGAAEVQLRANQALRARKTKEAHARHPRRAQPTEPLVINVLMGERVMLTISFAPDITQLVLRRAEHLLGEEVE